MKNFLQFMPLPKKLAFIVLLFVLIVACLLVLACAQMEILSAVRAYVGGEWRDRGGANVTELGTVSSVVATRYLLDLAAGGAGAVGGAAVFAAVLADSVTVWPDALLESWPVSVTELWP